MKDGGFYHGSARVCLDSLDCVVVNAKEFNFKHHVIEFATVARIQMLGDAPKRDHTLSVTVLSKQFSVVGLALERKEINDL